MTALTTTISSADDNAQPSEQRVGEDRSVYAIVTERILAALAAGTVPWRKPWQSMPANLVSRKDYRGINAFLLGLAPYDSPYWLTFNQARKLGGSVRKGEQSTIVVFWKWLDKEDDTRIPLLRYYRVFNAEQCDGIDVPAIPETTAADDAIVAAHAVMSRMRDKPLFRVSAGGAYYSPRIDQVSMPPPRSFESAESWAATLYHELTHATGHEKRLNRPELKNSNWFGDHHYSREELVAEMGSAFLAARSGIASVTEPASASYLAHWIKALRGDSRLIVTAAAHAQRAVDYILGTTFETSEADEG
jgi:antirestriction protein ArdC